MEVDNEVVNDSALVVKMPFTKEFWLLVAVVGLFGLSFILVTVGMFQRKIAIETSLAEGLLKDTSVFSAIPNAEYKNQVGFVAFGGLVTLIVSSLGLLIFAYELAIYRKSELPKFFSLRKRQHAVIGLAIVMLAMAITDITISDNIWSSFGLIRNISTTGSSYSFY